MSDVIIPMRIPIARPPKATVKKDKKPRKICRPVMSSGFISLKVLIVLYITTETPSETKQIVSHLEVIKKMQLKYKYKIALSVFGLLV